MLGVFNFMQKVVFFMRKVFFLMQVGFSHHAQGFFPHASGLGVFDFMQKVFFHARGVFAEFHDHRSRRRLAAEQVKTVFETSAVASNSDCRGSRLANTMSETPSASQV